MLVVSDKRLAPSQVNTIILQGDDGRYYYLHRDLYDQLVVLFDNFLYGEATSTLANLLEHPMDTWPENVKMFYDTVPGPLKMAAPYLMLVTTPEQLETLEDMCGALTVISMSINLRRFCKVDKSIRAAMNFSLHVREEYRPHWDRFFQENPEYGAVASMPAPTPTIRQVPTPDGHIAVDEETGEELNITYADEAPSAEDLAAMLMAMPGMGGEEEEAPADTPSAGAPKISSGFDALKGV